VMVCCSRCVRDSQRERHKSF